ncbi:hypothetical protein SDC9_191154 [bioreactor metagenome]|uniref:Uncharacterized protein n=1 Tax=bioreactor metagenome TaxID=1076179 RepID=A0A645I5A0_9ZZZZ
MASRPSATLRASARVSISPRMWLRGGIAAGSSRRTSTNSASRSSRFRLAVPAMKFSIARTRGSAAPENFGTAAGAATGSARVSAAISAPESEMLPSTAHRTVRRVDIFMRAMPLSLLSILIFRSNTGNPEKTHARIQRIAERKQPESGARLQGVESELIN